MQTGDLLLDVVNIKGYLFSKLVDLFLQALKSDEGTVLQLKFIFERQTPSSEVA